MERELVLYSLCYLFFGAIVKAHVSVSPSENLLSMFVNLQLCLHPELLWER